MRGIRAGFNAVMLDSTALPYAEHARLTRQVVEAAHPIGVAVEAELGALPDGSGELGGEVGHMTDPDEAARFVAETGVDALAVSVGNIHILLEGQSPFDRPRLAAFGRLCRSRWCCTAAPASPTRPSPTRWRWASPKSTSARRSSAHSSPVWSKGLARCRNASAITRPSVPASRVM